MEWKEMKYYYWSTYPNHVMEKRWLEWYSKRKSTIHKTGSIHDIILSDEEITTLALMFGGIMHIERLKEYDNNISKSN